ncbi:Peptide deformylase [Azospirillaceae bacterium]
MAILPLIIAPDSRLKRVCVSVSEVDDLVRKLMDDMLESMYYAKGIGLAAPQIGSNLRVIVADIVEKDETPQPIWMANPEVVWRSEQINQFNEGCLSLPDQYADVVRPTSVRIRYLSRDNKWEELEADGLLSTCLQHEIDHLDGVLFVDHISLLRRNIIMRKLQKMKKHGD